MKNRKFFRVAHVGFFLILICYHANAQLYLGLSANIGNQLSYSPTSPGLKTPSAISGSLVFAYEQQLKNDWFIQYGVDLGVLGFIIRVQSFDTLTSISDTYTFAEYSSIYGNLGLLAGKEIKIGKKKLMLGIGGGVSLYTATFPYVTYGIHQALDNYTIETTFSAETNCPITTALPYARILAQIKLNRRLNIGLSYTHHFESILEGSYEFYHTETPSSGAIALYPREINLVFMYRVSGKKNYQINNNMY